MGVFFGTDGIRGEAGQPPLDAPTIERIGYSLTRVLTARLGRPPLIVIGRDTRESGPWIEAAIARGIVTAGGTLRAAGVIPTPGVAFLTRALEADAGVVISASHNPFQDNGIKVFSPSGQKLDDAAEQAIEKDLKAGADIFPHMRATNVAVDPGLQERYLGFLRDEVGGKVDLRGLRLILDCANGASSELAPRLFTALGAEVQAINAAPDGSNINFACGSLHPETLQRAVVAAGADLGLAFDGDADRLLLIDEKGQLVDGDQTLFVLADHLAARAQLAGNRVVATVMSNLGLEVALRQRGITLTRTAVGDKYVLEELLRNGGSLGGEQSGHLIFPGISLAGDGMLSALEVLRVMSATRSSLGELSVGFVRYPQIIINLRVARKPPLEGMPTIKAAIDELSHQLEGNGRLLVRYSGTENLVRVMIEGQDEATIRAQAERLIDLLSEYLS